MGRPPRGAELLGFQEPGINFPSWVMQQEGLCHHGNRPGGQKEYGPPPSWIVFCECVAQVGRVRRPFSRVV